MKKFMNSSDINKEDADCARRILAGDRQVYAEIVRRHQGKVLRLCSSLLKNETDAQDAAQEVFIKAYEALFLRAGRLAGFV